MTRSPRSTPLPIDRARRRFSATAVCMTALVAVASLWALRGSDRSIDEALARAERLGAATGSTDTGSTNSSERRAVTIPASALTATLDDELFPKPPPEAKQAPPPPPPKLDFALLAINARPDGTVAFVRDTQTGELLQLVVGDKTTRGAVVRAIDNISVTFKFGGREARLELAR